MDFNELKKANEQICTIDVKGKQYAEVNQRIKAFRMLFPNGSIVTDLISNDSGICIIKATVKDETGFILGTGTAYEKEGSTFINKTSYIENCETSAVGRALGMCGIGIDTSVASYEEVSNAIVQQEEEKIIDEKKVEVLKTVMKTKGVTEKQICERYNVDSIKNLTAEKYKKALKALGNTSKSE